MKLVAVRGDGHPSSASGSHPIPGAGYCFSPTTGLLMRLPGSTPQSGLLLCQVLAIMQNMIFDSVFEVDSVLENESDFFDSC